MATSNNAPADQQVKDEAANLPAGTEISTSGAVQQIVPDVDLSHPAVDANPRERTSVVQNAIDFNDPTISGAEAVARNLRAQGMTVNEPSAPKAKANK